MSRALTSRRGTPWATSLLLLALLLAVGVTWPVWSDPTHRFIGPGGDQQLTMSFFGLTQHALASLHDPFYSAYLNAPDGVNLAWETASPLIAILMWPVDATAGPVAGYDVAMVLAIALNAWVAALALRRVVGGRIGATVGGLLYGFSPFVNAHARNHLELTILVTPPLLMIVVDRVLRTHSEAWVRNGVLLAAVVVAQFYISVEVLFIEIIATAAVLAASAVTHIGSVRRLLPTLLRTGSLAVGVSLVATAWPLYVQLTYPQRPTSAIQGTDIYVADVANLVIPNSNEALSPFSALATHFAGNGAEATSYVGVPLAFLLVGLLVWQRRSRTVLMVALTAVAMFVISLGGHVRVLGHVVRHVPLPWLFVEKLPVFKDLLTARIWLVVYLAIAVLVALGVNLVSRRGRWVRAGVASLLVLTAVTFFPALPWFAASPAVPAFFTGDATRISTGSTVLLAPLPYDLQSDAELWQAWSGTRFKIPGGYIHGPEYEHPRTLEVLATAMYAIEHGHPVAPTAPEQLLAMRGELAATDIHTVVLGPALQHDALQSLLIDVCGASPAVDQGVEIWWSCTG